MSFFRRFAKTFTQSKPDRRFTVTVQCLRCGEVITAPVDLWNELSFEDDEHEEQSTNYICRKVIMGRQRCFQQIEVTLHFDKNRQLTAKEITGGKFVEG
jgi:uncharacterized metal-binding protein YceD (DUF177 family)